MADFVGERVSDVRMKKEGVDIEADKEAIFDKELSKEEKQDNLIVIVQIPLKQKVIHRRRGKGKAKLKKKNKKSKKSMQRRSKCIINDDISDDEDANIEAAIVKIAERKVKCICGQELEKTKVSDCYEGKGIECDKCGKAVSDKEEEVYHCCLGRHYQHSEGYDLCINCGDEQLKFDELRGMMDVDKEYELKRDQDYPVRVTLQC